MILFSQRKFLLHTITVDPSNLYRKNSREFEKERRQGKRMGKKLKRARDCHGQKVMGRIRFLKCRQDDDDDAVRNAECSLFMRIIQADVVGRGATEDLMVAVISYNFLITEEGFSLLVGHWKPAHLASSDEHMQS